MKRLLTITFLLILLIPLSLKAITKDEVLNYVDSKISTSDNETSSFLEKYYLQFSRLINSKELNEDELDLVYKKLVEVNNILDSYSVVTRDDLKYVPEDVKSKIKDILYDIVLIITKSNGSTQNVIKINEDDTIDIVIDGAVIDKIDLSNKTFNYVGINKSFYYIIVIAFIIFIISIFSKIVFRNKRFLNNLFFSLTLFSFVLGTCFILFSSNINKYISLLQLFKKNDDIITKSVLVDSNHNIIRYPSYYSEYASLKISRLDIEEKVVFGDNNEILNKYVGHTTTSYLPGEGKTIIYSVHNYKVPSLENIKIKDNIYITTDYGNFTYEVEEIKIMNYDEYDLIKLNDNKEQLIIYTCYPFGISLYGNKRFVVFATLTNEEWVAE